MAKIAIYWTIFSSLALLLFIGTAYKVFQYRKNERNFITVKKMIIMSIFFSIFMLQSLFTRFFDHVGVIAWSLDSVTVVVIGLLFGPLEAMFYGAIADPTRVLINGWDFQALPMLFYPLMGLLSGYAGDLRKKKSELSPKTNMILTQIPIIIILVTGFALYPLLKSNGNKNAAPATIYGSIASIIILETIFIYFFVKKKEMTLMSYVIILTVVNRYIFGVILRSYTQYYFYGNNLPWGMASRILTSTYLVPSTAFVVYTFTEISEHAINITGGRATWQ